MADICVICEEDEATARCVTCRKCRAYIHRWGSQKDDRIIGHFDKLRVRVKRMTTFAIIKDETVRHVDMQELQENKIIFLSKREKRRTKSNVVSIKVAEQMRRRA
jgi:hypothetical protein